MSKYHPNWPKDLVLEAESILEQIDFKNTSPAREDVLKFLLLDPKAIKVAILGQDPYPTPGVANGRAFAVNAGTRVPASLQNLFKEIKSVQGHVSTKPDLAHWEAQGVLLLNAALTVTNFEPGSHRAIWHDFVIRAIKFLDANNKDIVWVLWGRDAERLGAHVSGIKIIEAHPSPLSARRRTGITFKKLKQIDW